MDVFFVGHQEIYNLYAQHKVNTKFPDNISKHDYNFYKFLQISTVNTCMHCAELTSSYVRVAMLE